MILQFAGRMTAALVMVLLSLAAAELALAGEPAAVAVPAGVSDISVLTARGLLQPRIEAILSSQIAGRILRLNVREGQRVSKGELLVEFDCEAYRAELAIATAELESARLRLSSNQQLAQLKSIGRFEVALAEAELAKAEATARAREIPVSRCRVPAPFGGRIGEVKVHAHESVEAGDEMLALLDDHSLEIRLIVPSAWLAWLRTGRAARFTLDETATVLNATMTRLGARIDPVSQTVPVFGEFQDGPAEGLVAGMTGTAFFTRESAAVPQVSGRP